jgi:long-chain acyl-CoA synthetase
MNLATMAEDAIDRFGVVESLVFDGDRYSNTQLFGYSKQIHRRLEELGVRRGACIVLCMVNHPLIFPAFGGIFRSGATAVPVMFVLTAAELRYVVSDCRAEAIITDTHNLEKVRIAVDGLDHVRWIAVVGGEENAGAGPREFPLESFLDSEQRDSLPQIDGDDVAIMMYTSGTTGRPKGVMLTHANIAAQGEAIVEAAGWEHWEGPYISISAMPMAHIFGVGVMVTGYVMPKSLVDQGGYGVQMAWFDPEPFMALLQEHRCTTMPAVPTMLSLILNHPKLDQYDLTSLKEVTCGASPLPEEVARAFMDRFDCRVREIYGLTECTGLGSANRVSLPYRPGSAGQAYCNTEIRIVDSNDNPLPAGTPGEITLRGPTVMKGYLNQPEQTAEALRGGWLHTGDVGYLDAEGFLYVVDRVKDMIIRGGENIYPAELEDILYEFEGVAEAAVVGTPDPVYGESVVAFVVAAPGAELSEPDIIDFVKTRTSGFRVPSKVHFVETLPKTLVGKILRRELRQKARDLEG